MGLAGKPVDPATYSLVRERLADQSLCGKYHRTGFADLPPPPPSSNSSRRSRKSSQRRSATTPPKPPKQPKPQTHFEVERITEEAGRWGGHSRWFLVQWKGYHPSWEPYRARGEPGTPVETWEPLTVMRRTEALKAWDAAKA